MTSRNEQAESGEPYAIDFGVLMETGNVVPADRHSIPLDLHPPFEEPSAVDLRPFEGPIGMPPEADEASETRERIISRRSASEDEGHRGDDGYNGLYHKSRHHGPRKKGTGLPVAASEISVSIESSPFSKEPPEIDGVIVGPEEIEALDEFRSSNEDGDLGLN